MAAQSSTTSRKRQADSLTYASGMSDVVESAIQRQKSAPSVPPIWRYARFSPTDDVCRPIDLSSSLASDFKMPSGYPFTTLEKCNKQFTIDRSPIRGLSDVPDDLQRLLAGFIGESKSSVVMPIIEMDQLVLNDLLSTLGTNSNSGLAVRLIELGYGVNSYNEIVEALFNFDRYRWFVRIQVLKAMTKWPVAISKISPINRARLLSPIIGVALKAEDAILIVDNFYPLYPDDLLYLKNATPVIGWPREEIWLRMMNKFVLLLTFDTFGPPDAYGTEGVRPLTASQEKAVLDFYGSQACDQRGLYIYRILSMLPFSTTGRLILKKLSSSSMLAALVLSKPTASFTAEDFKEISSLLLLGAGDSCNVYIPYPISSDILIQNFDRLGGLANPVMNWIFTVHLPFFTPDTLNFLLTKVNDQQRRFIVDNVRQYDPAVNYTQDELESIIDRTTEEWG